MPSTATTGQVTLRFLAAPTDAGQGGSVSGGRILEWIDKAGFACAAGWSGRYCVTAYVGNIDFHRPVQVGDLVEVSAQLVLTGRSSMTIVVDVSSGNPRGGRVEHAFECRMVFVAVDDDGRTVEVPQWNPPGAVLRAAQAEARRRVQLREQVKALVAAQDWDGETGAHGSTLRFLAAPTDVNWGGKVHGGILMRWLDETGYVCASAWSHTHVVSRFSGGVSFLRPIRIGDLVDPGAARAHRADLDAHRAAGVGRQPSDGRAGARHAVHKCLRGAGRRGASRSGAHLEPDHLGGSGGPAARGGVHGVADGPRVPLPPPADPTH
jgi:acyl-CoA hydrolase